MNSDDYVYVLDTGSGHVSKLTADGQPPARWLLAEESATADLVGLAVDRHGQVYVADRRR